MVGPQKTGKYAMEQQWNCSWNIIKPRETPSRACGALLGLPFCTHFGNGSMCNNLDQCGIHMISPFVSQHTHTLDCKPASGAWAWSSPPCSCPLGGPAAPSWMRACRVWIKQQQKHLFWIKSGIQKCTKWCSHSMADEFPDSIILYSPQWSWW